MSREAARQPVFAKGDGFGALKTPGKNAAGTLESDFKQIKDLLNNDQGEKRLDKAGLKPQHRSLLPLKR